MLFSNLRYLIKLEQRHYYIVIETEHMMTKKSLICSQVRYLKEVMKG